MKRRRYAAVSRVTRLLLFSASSSIDTRPRWRMNLATDSSSCHGRGDEAQGLMRCTRGATGRGDGARRSLRGPGCSGAPRRKCR